VRRGYVDHRVKYSTGASLGHVSWIPQYHC